MTETSVLQQVPLFHSLNDDELRELYALMEQRSFPPGETIIQEGDRGDCLYILLRGNVQVLTRNATGEEVLLSEIGHGAFFGEMSLLTSEPRSATVRAVDLAQTLTLYYDAFYAFLSAHPRASLTMLTALARRLGETAHLVRTTTRNVNEIEASQSTLGQRIADKFASSIGSWLFIGVQSVLLLIYIIWNIVKGTAHFDPYPFLLMSLILSFQAAYSAPIIMMSQNRQSAKDRLTANNTYEINVKTSAEIGLILERLDRLENRINARSGVQPPDFP